MATYRLDYRPEKDDEIKQRIADAGATLLGTITLPPEPNEPARCSAFLIADIPSYRQIIEADDAHDFVVRFTRESPAPAIPSAELRALVRDILDQIRAFLLGHGLGMPRGAPLQEVVTALYEYLGAHFAPPQDDASDNDEAQ